MTGKHSQPILSADGRYFLYQGKPFFYFADTFWYGCSARCSRNDFKIIIDDRAKKGVNVIQLVVGFPPEADIQTVINLDQKYSPLKKDLSLNPEYFLEVKWRLEYIVKQGIIPNVVAGWGWHIDELGIDKISEIWKELLLTLGDLPAFLCLCGEIDLFPIDQNTGSSSIKRKLFNKIKKLPISILRPLKKLLINSGLLHNESKLSERLKKWKKIVSIIKEYDHQKRLLTSHVTGMITASELYKDTTLFDFDVIQSGHQSGKETRMKKAIELNTKNGRIIINMEPAYEGIFNDFWGNYQLKLFRTCIEAGAKGHSYGAHGVWNMSTKMQPNLDHWGKSDWKVALKFKGLNLIANDVKLLTKRVWWKK